MRFAAINTGFEIHLLDHIAPLADLFEMPLLIAEERTYEFASTYYPQVSLFLEPHLEQDLSSLASRFDVLFECKYWQPHLKSLFKDLFGKSMRLIFCPHGQSDKGYQTPLLAPYQEQDCVLFYGSLLQQMLKDLEIEARGVSVGNFRLHFYQKYRPFYDSQVEEKIFSKIPPKAKTLLYAPTWQDADGSSSFFEKTKSLLQDLPSDWNLLIKPHPLLEQREPIRFERLVQEIKKENVLLIDAYPPIYPLLNRVDAYLGDCSSVGYDVLWFEKPMFFFHHPNILSGRLSQVGKVIDDPKEIFSSPMDQNKELQKKLYREAFDPVDAKKTKKALLQLF